MRKKLLTGFLTAMLAISLVPAMPASEAKAANAIVYNRQTPTKVLNNKKIYLYVGGKSVNLDYNIAGRKSGVKGTWSSSNTSVATVNKYGVVKAVGNGSSTITYKFLNGSKYKTLTVKVTARTRAASVALSANPDSHTATPGAVISFTSTLTPNAKALSINSDISSTYTVYYDVWSDMACTVPVTDGAIAFSTATGTQTTATVARPGTYYVTATAKNSPNAVKYNVRSTPYQLIVAEDTSVSVRQTNTNQITVSSNKPINGTIVTTSANSEVAQLSQAFSADRKTEVITLTSNLIGTYSVTINTEGSTKQTAVTCEGSRVNSIKLNQTTVNKAAGTSTSNGAKAYAYFSVFDQFGNNVTTNPAIGLDNNVLALYNNVAQKITSCGVVELDLDAKAAVKGTKGVLTITYRPINATAVTDTETITIGDEAALDSLKLAGIYVYNSKTKTYSCVFGSEASGLSAATVMNIKYPGLSAGKYKTDEDGYYYILLSAKDSNGVNITDASLIELNLLTDTGIEVDNKASTAGTVKIGDSTYIAYPVKAEKGIKSGSLEIQAIAGSNTFERIKKNIPSKISLGHIEINSAVVTYKKNVKNMVDLEATFYDTTGSKITSGDTVENLIKVNGQAVYTLSSYLTSNNGTFVLGKNSDGSPLLMFAPNDSQYPVGQSVLTEWTNGSSADKKESGRFYITREN